MKKEKHIWASQILDELLCHASLYGYEDNGRNPKQSSQKQDAETTAPYSYSDDHKIVSFDNTIDSQHPPGGSEAQTSSATDQQAPADQSLSEAQQKEKDNGKNKHNDQGNTHLNQLSLQGKC